jgi:protein-S-isoprenylcysteine O-methyltransferase Ste14
MKTIMERIGVFLFKHRNLVFPLTIVAAYLFIVPPDETFGSRLLEQWKDVAAVSMVLAGVILRTLVLSFTAVPRAGVGREVNAESLFTGGLFGACRNPLYVGNMLIYSGVFFMHGDPRIVIGGIVVFGFFYQCIIAAEEAYLRGRFGAEYAAYCGRTPRWGFRLSALPASLREAKFSLKQGLMIDYNPAANAVAMLAATEIYETLYEHGHGDQRLFLLFLAGVIVAAAAWTAALRRMKKRSRLAAAQNL